MTSFADILKTFPAIDDIAAINLYQAGEYEPAAVIENQPGKAGSVAVYNALLQEFGKLDIAAAQKGLSLYAEHVADAESNPGKHPNIDRLFRIIEQQSEMRMEIIKRD
jgi:hypothetical protein